MNIVEKIAQDLHIEIVQINNTLSLLEEGNSVPFIARYRKERTKGLDEEQIRVIAEEYEYQVNLKKRKEDVLRLIETQGKLSDEIVRDVNACTKLSQVEDIYRPYKQKKKTRAGVAIANGLQPLADALLKLPKTWSDVDTKAFLSDVVSTHEEAMQGAQDIIAEMVAENTKVRNKIYDSMVRYGKIKSQVKKNAKDDMKVYKMYYAHEERLESVAPHRIMAMDRGEKEKVLSVSITLNEEYIYTWTRRRYISYEGSACIVYIEAAIQDGLKRLAYPSMENMVRTEWSEKAHESSIDVFSMNLEKLLLQAPMKDKVVLGFDPAFRTGCKLALVNGVGQHMCVDVIYPHKPNAKVEEAKRKLVDLIKKYKVDIIAIGNGTASRESERFVSDLIAQYTLDVSYTIVSEAGASVYSASPLAIAEFPQLQVEQRSAISIARRLLDPLSELIKIDPQSIGVGQYQHDLPVSRLKQRLEFVVEKAVNLVGVNINTASAVLLKNVAGLNASMAASIVAYRESHGRIETRKEIKSIPKIGAKSFTQAAGFLRIEDGDEILDATSIHPESYKVAKKVMKQLGMAHHELGSERARGVVESACKNDLMASCEVDEYTLDDILDSIVQPLRDYRDQSDAVILKKDVLELEDLHVGDELDGTVRNVVDFGAFVDVGLHEDGLVHISKMSKKRIAHPSEAVSVGDIVKVWVANIDEEKQKVQLTLLQP